METPSPHDTNTCVKLTRVTHLSFSERLAIANLSYSYKLSSSKYTYLIYVLDSVLHSI